MKLKMFAVLLVVFVVCGLIAAQQAAPPPAITQTFYQLTAPTRINVGVPLFDFASVGGKSAIALVNLSNAGAQGGTLISPAYFVYQGDVHTRIDAPANPSIPSAGQTIPVELYFEGTKLMGKYVNPGPAPNPGIQVVVVAIYQK